MKAALSSIEGRRWFWAGYSPLVLTPPGPVCSHLSPFCAPGDLALWPVALNSFALWFFVGLCQWEAAVEDERMGLGVGRVVRATILPAPLLPQCSSGSGCTAVSDPIGWPFFQSPKLTYKGLLRIPLLPLPLISQGVNSILWCPWVFRYSFLASSSLLCKWALH